MFNYLEKNCVQLSIQSNNINDHICYFVVIFEGKKYDLLSIKSESEN